MVPQRQELRCWCLSHEFVGIEPEGLDTSGGKLKSQGAITCSTSALGLSLSVQSLFFCLYKQLMSLLEMEACEIQDPETNAEEAQLGPQNAYWGPLSRNHAPWRAQNTLSSQ